MHYLDDRREPFPSHHEQDYTTTKISKTRAFRQTRKKDTSCFKAIGLRCFYNWFHLVAKHGSMAAAAKELGRHVNALGREIALLEESIGTSPLRSKHNKHLVLTEASQEVAKYAPVVLDSIASSSPVLNRMTQKSRFLHGMGRMPFICRKLLHASGKSTRKLKLPFNPPQKIFSSFQG